MIRHIVSSLFGIFCVLGFVLFGFNTNAEQLFTIYNAPYTYPSTSIVNYARNNQFLIGNYKRPELRITQIRKNGLKNRKTVKLVSPLNSRGSLPPLPTAVHRSNYYSLNDLIKFMILKKAERYEGRKVANLTNVNLATKSATVTGSGKTTKVAKSKKPANALKRKLILTLHYPLSSYTLTPQQKVKLIAELRPYKNKKLYVEGYTDMIGSKKYNDNLARKRAETVVEFLNKHGFKASALPSFGKYRPLKTAKESRRAEVYVVEKPEQTASQSHRY